MNEEQQPTCPACGYDLTGAVYDKQTVTCPECGANPRVMRLHLTRREFHKRLAMALLIPFIGWFGIVYLLINLPEHFHAATGLFVLPYLIVKPVALPSTAICMWSRLHHDAKIYPRPYPRRLIPLWVAAYTIPAAIAYLFLLGVIGISI